MHIKTIELTAPSSWASYLINSDPSSLTDDEQTAVRNWLRNEQLELVQCVDARDSGFIKLHDAYAPAWPFAADCQTYTFHVFDRSEV